MKKKENFNYLNTVRFCSVCRKNRFFVYQKIIGHSQCQECGSGFAKAFKEFNISALKNALKIRRNNILEDVSTESMKERLREIDYVLFRISRLEINDEYSPKRDKVSNI